MKSILLVALSSTALAQTCYDGVRVFIARGTGEPQNSSVTNLMGKAILAQIPNSYSTEVTYPADTSGTSVGIGVSDAQNKIYSYAESCPASKIVLMGYSQGAAVIGNAIAGGNAANSPPSSPVCDAVAPNIVAVVQFGDPGRKLGVGVDSDVNGPSCNVSATNPRSGAALAAIEKYEYRLSEWCNYDDFVCCQTGTTFAAHLSYWTNENADTVASYVAEKASSATLTSATLGSSCTAVAPPPTTTTAATTSAPGATGTGVQSGAPKPSSIRASASGGTKPSSVRSGVPSSTGSIVKPSTPTGYNNGTLPSVPSYTGGVSKMQTGVMGGAAAAVLAGAMML